MLTFQLGAIKKLTIEDFSDQVVKELSSSFHYFETSELQMDAWRQSANWVHRTSLQLSDSRDNLRVIFEFNPPLSTERPDLIIVGSDKVLVVEAKTGTQESLLQSKKQVLRYARNLYNYVDIGREKSIIPVLLRTGAKNSFSPIENFVEPSIDSVLDISPEKFADLLEATNAHQDYGDSAPENWLFNPRPSIVDAARLMFNETSAKDVLISMADDEELMSLINTCEKLTRIAKLNKEHIVLAVSGVPGAGKTLVGLRLANSSSIHDLCSGDDTSSPLYLSGNGPLVDVLTEALSRDERIRRKCSAEEAREVALAKIRLIHGLTSDKFAVRTHVLIFDEAQRAWTEDRMQSKLQKKGLRSEAEEVLQRMESVDWAVVVCLIGTGQQINDGEEGMTTWTKAIKGRRVAGKIWTLYGDANTAKRDGSDTNELVDTPHLHLKVVRRADNASMLGDWVEKMLNGEFVEAANLKKQFPDFPIYITRNLQLAKSWLRDPSRPHFETYGLLASSKSARLSPYGVDAQAAAGMTHDWTQWFLDRPPNLNSSELLEVAATEFKCQGLELDRTCLCWSWDLIPDGPQWRSRKIDKRGGKWMNIKNEYRHSYAINAYRVLLTRARLGMVIWVPTGDADDSSRSAQEVDSIFQVLMKSGCSPLESSSDKNR